MVLLNPPRTNAFFRRYNSARKQGRAATAGQSPTTPLGGHIVDAIPWALRCPGLRDKVHTAGVGMPIRGQALRDTLGPHIYQQERS